MSPGRLIAVLIALNIVLIGRGCVVVRAKPPAGIGIRVGLVFDVGGKNDKSFNEAA